MIEIRPNTLYTLNDLDELLRGHVELSTFLERLGLKKDRVFRDAVWGWEILEASRKAPSYASLSKLEGAPAGPRPSAMVRPVPRKGGPVRRFSALDLED